MEIIKPKSTDCPIRPSRLVVWEQIENNAKFRDKQLKAEITPKQRNALKMMAEGNKDFRRQMEQMRKQINALVEKSDDSE